MSSGREAASAAAWKKVPALKGVTPVVSKSGQNTLYTFAKSVPGGPGGRSVRQVVKVTVSPEGRVLKVVASR